MSGNRKFFLRILLSPTVLLLLTISIGSAVWLFLAYH